jgi:hypothetical protein
MFTNAQMEQVLEKLDHRLRKIEQKLPTLATKQDLQALAKRVDELSEVDLAAVRHEFETHTTWVDEQFAGVHRRFDAMDQRFGAVDLRFDAMDQRFAAVDRRFDALDQRFDALDQRFAAMDQRFDAMDQRFDGMDQHFDAMEKRMDIRFDDVGAQVNERFDRLEAHLVRLQK